MSQGLPDRIVLGHNSFFGIDHLSAKRGHQRAIRFSDPAQILAQIKVARSLGAGGMMLSTHSRASSLCEMIAGDDELRRDLNIYPLLPYAQKYVIEANEKGLLTLVLDRLRLAGTGGSLSLIARVAKGALLRDVHSVLSVLIELELQMFRGLRVQTVFLHEILTDLALALDLPEVLEFYMTEIRRRYGYQPGLSTKNCAVLLARFSAWGVEPPAVLTHVNKLGFNMNPGRDACVAAIDAHAVEVMAMSTLASGYLSAEDAYRYLATIRNIKSVVVGASTPSHAQETFQAITRHMPPDASAAPND